MNLTKDKVKLVGYTFSISLLIPPNMGLNYLGLNFEDLPLVFLFLYLLYFKFLQLKKSNFTKHDYYFCIFIVAFFLYTNLAVDNLKLFNQTNLRFYFYFLLAYLVVNSFVESKENFLMIFESLSIVMIANFILILGQFNLNGDINGWISNNTSGNNPFTSGRLGGFQGGGPNVIGIFCAISSLVCLYKIINSDNYLSYLKNQKYNTVILFISLLNLYLTYSRGSYLALGIGVLFVIFYTESIQRKNKYIILSLLGLFSFLIISINPSIFLKQTNRTYLTDLALENVRLFKGTGGGNYIKEVYKSYLITLEDDKLIDQFNITYSEIEKDNKKEIEYGETGLTKGLLKLKFDYKDGLLPKSVISFFFSNDGSNWEQIGFDHSNGTLIDLIPNDSYFEVGGWGDGQSNDDSFLAANINEVSIVTESANYIYKFPKYKRGIDYYILTPRLRNVYRGDLNFTETGIQLERPREYWLALPNYTNLSGKDFEVLVDIEIDGIPKGNETIFSQSSIFRLNEEFNDQSWKWSIVDGRMYFFWIEDVDFGYSNYLGGMSLRSGKLISVDGKFDSVISEFNVSQYDEITTSHNGFLTMSVEYGIFPVTLILILCLYSTYKNFQRKYTLELSLFLMLLVQNLTNDLIYSPDVSIYFWLIPMYFSKNLFSRQ